MEMYNFFLLAFLAVVILGIVKGSGDNRTIIIFRDYDDLGLTFLIPASFILIVYIFAMLGGNPAYGMILGGAVTAWLFFLLVKNTYMDNGKSIGKSSLALITKLPLAIIWVLNLVALLNPSGKGAQRRRNRGQALVILTILTPIIGMLIVDKTGSYFNPKSWISGGRVGSRIRSSL